MTPGEWIALIGLILFWAGTLITFWIKIKIKIAELEIMIKNDVDNLNSHIKWGEIQQQSNISNLKDIRDEGIKGRRELLEDINVMIINQRQENKEEHIYMIKKIDDLISKIK